MTTPAENFHSTICKAHVKSFTDARLADELFRILEPGQKRDWREVVIAESAARLIRLSTQWSVTQHAYKIYEEEVKQAEVRHKPHGVRVGVAAMKLAEAVKAAVLYERRLDPNYMEGKDVNETQKR